MTIVGLSAKPVRCPHVVGVTFQALPGTAILLSVDQIGWAENYEGSTMFSRAGVLVDISWALGKKSPMLLYG
jgi:hypothetical protein